MLLILMMQLNVLPVRYTGAVIGLTIFLAILMILMQFPRKMRLAGCILSGIFCLVFILGDIYLARTHMVLSDITVEDNNYKVDQIVIAVLKDDPAEELEDTLIYNFGIQKTLDRENTDTTISNIEEQGGTTLNVTEFDDLASMAQALYDGQVQAVIICSL